MTTIAPTPDAQSTNHSLAASDSILYLTAEDVRRACKEVDAVAVMREVFTLHGNELTRLPDEAYLQWDNARGERARSLNMPAFVGGSYGAAGTKIINANVANPSRGLPRASGLTILFDPDSARVECVMDAAHISSLRTAAVSLLAAECCAAPSASTLGVIGAGVIAQAHVDLFAGRLPGLNRVLVFDKDSSAARRLVERLEAQVLAGVSIEVRESAEEVVRNSDIVIPATTTTTSYIPHDWLRAGALLIHVSLDDAMPDVIMGADLLIVDDWHLVRADERRLLGRMIRQGHLFGPHSDHPVPVGARRVDAQLSDVVTGGMPGRRTPEDIVVVNPFGLAIEDVALAHQVRRTAHAMGLGRELPR